MWKNVESGQARKKGMRVMPVAYVGWPMPNMCFPTSPRSDDSLLAAPQTGRGKKSRKQTDKRVLSFELCMIGTQQTPRALSDYK